MHVCALMVHLTSHRAVVGHTFQDWSLARAVMNWDGNAWELSAAGGKALETRHPCKKGVGRTSLSTAACLARFPFAG